ncbi:MAG: hypothetical protein OEM52_12750, partial [bacterium]|nr:hypothetical protein [bacterium]
MTSQTNEPTSEPKKIKSDGVLWRRVMVAVWGIPLLTIPTLLGGWSFAVLIALIAAMAMFEYMTILRHSGAEVVRTSSAILSAAV